MTRLTQVLTVGVVVLAVVAVALGQSAAYAMGALQGVTRVLADFVILPFDFVAVAVWLAATRC
jgi:hypothetical protein